MSERPFHGEIMTCIMSGEMLVSDPTIESGWDGILFGGKSYYVSDKWRDTSYKIRGVTLTYKLITEKIMQLHKEGQS